MANKSRCTNKAGKNISLSQHPAKGNNTNTNINNSKNIVNSIAVNKQGIETNNNCDKSNDDSASTLKANKNNNNSNNLFIDLLDNLKEYKNNEKNLQTLKEKKKLKTKNFPKPNDRKSVTSAQYADSMLKVDELRKSARSIVRRREEFRKEFNALFDELSDLSSPDIIAKFADADISSLRKQHERMQRQSSKVKALSKRYRATIRN